VLERRAGIQTTMDGPWFCGKGDQAARRRLTSAQPKDALSTSAEPEEPPMFDVMRLAIGYAVVASVCAWLHRAGRTESASPARPDGQRP